MLTLTSMVTITSNRVMTMVAREQHHLMPATVVTLVATVGTLRRMIALLIKVLKLQEEEATTNKAMETRISINSLLPRTHNIMGQVALNLSLKLRIPILQQLLTISNIHRLELTMNTTISSIMLELELDKQQQQPKRQVQVRNNPPVTKDRTSLLSSNNSGPTTTPSRQPTNSTTTGSKQRELHQRMITKASTSLSRNEQGKRHRLYCKPLLLPSPCLTASTERPL